MAMPTAIEMGSAGSTRCKMGSNASVAQRPASIAGRSMAGGAAGAESPSLRGYVARRFRASTCEHGERARDRGGGGAHGGASDENRVEDEVAQPELDVRALVHQSGDGLLAPLRFLHCRTVTDVTDVT